MKTESGPRDNEWAPVPSLTTQGSLPLNVFDVQICDISCLELWGAETPDSGRYVRPWKTPPTPWYSGEVGGDE